MATCKECEYFEQGPGRRGTCSKQPYLLSRGGRHNYVQKHNGEPIIKNITWGHNACKLFEKAGKAADQIEDADVAAPEVEQLIYKLECLLCHATGGLLSKHMYDLRTMESAVTDYVEKCCDEARAEAKVEVAREIFEEISKASVGWGCYCITTSKAGYLTNDVNRTLAELKKKYTEEQKDG